MTAERWLVWLLRANAVLMMLALPAVFMPHAWMDAIHQRMGLGTLPEIPMIGYLTRGTSLFYVMLGAATWLMSTDLRRYRVLIYYWGATCVVASAALFVIDNAIGMPRFWTLSEAPYLLLLGIAVVGLQYRAQHNDAAEDV